MTPSTKKWPQIDLLIKFDQNKAKLHRYSWSRCSNNELKDVIKNYECLKKKPVKSLKQQKDQKYTRNITPIGPNTFSPIIEKGKNEMYNYTLDEQCQFAFGNEFSWCDTITSENSECQVILYFQGQINDLSDS